MQFTVISLVGHFSFALTACSFLVKDILFLRALAIASALVSIVYNYNHPAGTNWLPIFWLSLFTGINVWRIIGILTERYSIRFSEEERELYETLFRHFEAVEFMKLMRLAEWREAAEGEVFAEAGKPLDGLRLLFSGEVAVTRDGKEIGRSRDGALIGEMSFIQGGEATATVTTIRPCRYVFWPKAELQGLLRRNPSIDVAMKHVFSLDLTRKLTNRGGPLHTADLAGGPAT